MTAPAIHVARAIGPVVVQPNPIRAYLPQRYWDKQADYFVYSVEYNTLGASAVNVAQSFQVQADSDFLVLGLSGLMATAAAGTAEQAFWSVVGRIFDSGTGAAWFDQLQNFHNIFGRGNVDAQGMRVLPYPRFVEASSVVTVEATNLDANARRFWLSFHGLKIFRDRIR